MISPPRNKVPTARDRADQMRKRRADSSTLREVSPETASVNVHLEFLPLSAPPHAAQSFVLYPAARAFFEYPCPYGDCDGVYNFSAEAKRVLGHEKKSVAGTVECSGMRSRDGTQKQVCGLRVSYRISINRTADIEERTAL
jgi:hypothetical protein